MAEQDSYTVHTRVRFLPGPPKHKNTFNQTLSSVFKAKLGRLYENILLVKPLQVASKISLFLEIDI